ncbi:MAG: hypothetical protein K6G33_01120 [Ruminococcus sp.]|uniref:hypothetical protein n=1 Tax=Ruminococcus sp. TaxID=41978 RepID=UPI0025F09E44|nr:hypothetical protein [Ruminococcus sp.]MCR5599334.1 hypothetical protein [Ruminococcus sp.]
MDERYLTINDAETTLISSLANELDFKYLKSQKCLKKTVKKLDFILNFYSCKWNKVGDRIEVNVGFHIYNKNYGKIPVDSVVASKMIKPKDKEWFDITTEEKLNEVFAELRKVLNVEIKSLCSMFEKNYNEAVEYLFNEKFDEFNVHLDYIADTLGKDIIQNKVKQISDSFSADIINQIEEYKNGARNKMWMLNRNNIKYIVDNNYI